MRMTLICICGLVKLLNIPFLCEHEPWANLSTMPFTMTTVYMKCSAALLDYHYCRKFNDHQLPHTWTPATDKTKLRNSQTPSCRERVTSLIYWPRTLRQIKRNKSTIRWNKIVIIKSGSIQSVGIKSSNR